MLVVGTGTFCQLLGSESCVGFNLTLQNHAGEDAVQQYQGLVAERNLVWGRVLKASLQLRACEREFLRLDMVEGPVRFVRGKQYLRWLQPVQTGNFTVQGRSVPQMETISGEQFIWNYSVYGVGLTAPHKCSIAHLDDFHMQRPKGISYEQCRGVGKRSEPVRKADTETQRA